MDLGGLHLCVMLVMCLHIFMQLCYDWNSHPSVGICFYGIVQIVAWMLLEEVALRLLSVCRSDT